MTREHKNASEGEEEKTAKNTFCARKHTRTRRSERPRGRGTYQFTQVLEFVFCQVFTLPDLGDALVQVERHVWVGKPSLATPKRFQEIEMTQLRGMVVRDAAVSAFM